MIGGRLAGQALPGGNASAMGKTGITTFLLYVLILALPFEGFSIMILGGKGVRPDWAIAILLAFFFFLESCMRKRTIMRSRSLLLLALLNLAVLFSVVTPLALPSSTGSLSEFLSTWVQLILVSVLFVCVLNLRATRAVVLRSVRLLIGIALLCSVYGIYQVFAHIYDLPLATITLTYPGMTMHGGSAYGIFERATSFFAEPKYFGTFLIPPMVLLGMTMIANTDTRIFYSRRTNLGILIVLGIGVLFSLSLSAYVILIAMGLLVFLFSAPRKKAKILVVALAACAILLIGDFGIDRLLGESFVQHFSLRIGSFIKTVRHADFARDINAPTSLPENFAVALDGLRVWASHPWIGVGLNNYQFYANPVVRGRELLVTGSSYVAILASSGILGFMTFVFFVWSIAALLRARIRDSALRSIQKAFTFVLVADVLLLILNMHWLSPVFWLHLSLVGLLYRTGRGDQTHGGLGDWARE